MAEAAAAAAEGAEGAAAGGKKAALVPALTFAGALLGGVIASMVVAPKIIARQAPPVTADSAAAADGEGHEAATEGKGGEGEGSEKKLVELSNIIVNPAGSQGTRFLMASVAFAVGDAEAEKLLRDHEVELRDKVTTVLETMTLAQLTAPGARDSLKARIGAVATGLIGKKTPVQVFLPQFVIQ